MSSDDVNETWQAIQNAVESLSTLAREEVSVDRFYGELVFLLCELASAFSADPADLRQ